MKGRRARDRRGGGGSSSGVTERGVCDTRAASAAEKISLLKYFITGPCSVYPSLQVRKWESEGDSRKVSTGVGGMKVKKSY